MSLLEALILGIVQGATEFLPISSSGHLVLLPWALGWQLDPEIEFAFNILVQVGTTLAVILYFWRDLWAIGVAVLRDLLARQPLASQEARQGWLIVFATLPAGVIGVLFKDFFEAVFQNPAGVSALLLGTALLLTIAEWRSSNTRPLESLGWRDALTMGLFQVLAIFPGVSRSGATIAGGMLRDLSRPAAARFSFLMAVPIMLAAGGLAIIDLLEAGNLLAYANVLLVGLVTAGVVGWLSIHWLLGFVAKNRLYGFAIYCTVIGLGGLLLAWVRG